MVGLYLLITNIYSLSAFVNFGGKYFKIVLHYNQRLEHGLASDHEVRRGAGNILAKVDGTEGLLLRSNHWHHGNLARWNGSANRSPFVYLLTDPE